MPALGASQGRNSESNAAHEKRALVAVQARKVSHPGNIRYLFVLGSSREKRAIEIGLPRESYPKQLEVGVTEHRLVYQPHWARTLDLDWTFGSSNLTFRGPIFTSEQRARGHALDRSVEMCQAHLEDIGLLPGDESEFFDSPKFRARFEWTAYRALLFTLPSGRRVRVAQINTLALIEGEEEA